MSAQWLTLLLLLPTFRLIECAKSRNQVLRYNAVCYLTMTLQRWSTSFLSKYVHSSLVLYYFESLIDVYCVVVLFKTLGYVCADFARSFARCAGRCARSVEKVLLGFSPPLSGKCLQACKKRMSMLTENNVLIINTNRTRLMAYSLA